MCFKKKLIYITFNYCFFKQNTDYKSALAKDQNREIQKL